MMETPHASVPGVETNKKTWFYMNMPVRVWQCLRAQLVDVYPQLFCCFVDPLTKWPLRARRCWDDPPATTPTTSRIKSLLKSLLPMIKLEFECFLLYTLKFRHFLNISWMLLLHLQLILMRAAQWCSGWCCRLSCWVRTCRSAGPYTSLWSLEGSPCVCMCGLVFSGFLPQSKDMQ